MRQKCVKNARNTFGGGNTFWTMPRFPIGALGVWLAICGRVHGWGVLSLLEERDMWEGAGASGEWAGIGTGKEPQSHKRIDAIQALFKNEKGRPSSMTGPSVPFTGLSSLFPLSYEGLGLLSSGFPGFS